MAYCETCKDYKPFAGAVIMDGEQRIDALYCLDCRLVHSPLHGGQINSEHGPLYMALDLKELVPKKDLFKTKLRSLRR